MRIWLPAGTAPTDTNWVSFGHLSGSAETADDRPVLAEVSDPGDPARAPGADAFFVPPGRALHGELLGALAETRRDVLVAVNGLGDRGIALIREAVPADHRVIAYRAADVNGAVLFEQLAWLANQPERFALAASGREQLTAAALAGADMAIVSDAAAVDLDALDRILAARADGVSRPAAPAEIDELSGREFCLTVSRDMAAGEVIAEADLAVGITEYRGLAPTMRHAVVGRTLRYPVAPGEALHFGSLK